MLRNSLVHSVVHGGPIRHSMSTWMDKIRDYFQKTTLAQSLAIFHNCKEQADNNLWYSKGLVGNDFRSRHAMLVIHIWMVHKRLLQEGKKGKLVQECLFDELWEDTTHRIRALGVNELSVNKRLSEVQGFSFKTCLELDHAVDKKTENDVIEDIGGSLWRSVYNRREDIADAHILEVARYVRSEQKSLLELPTEAIFEGRVHWGDLPSFNSVSKTVTDKSKASVAFAVSSGEWKQAMAADGKVYYWHTATRKTQWHKPAELK